MPRTARRRRRYVKIRKRGPRERDIQQVVKERKGKKEKMAKKKKKGKKEKKATGRGSGLKNMRISFKKVRKMTLGEVFGKKPISPPDIMRTVWALIKKKKLTKKKKED